MWYTYPIYMAESHAQISSRGGKTTLKRHGKAFFAANGHKGVATLLKKHGPQYFTELAKKALAGRVAKDKARRDKLITPTT